MTPPSPRPLSIQRGFLFGDVAVDAARQQLFVRGEEVRCRPLPFQLLLQLCEAGGAVVSRDEVFQRLWGGAYLPSDESLTQVVHRLRSVLGPDGKAVRTVRGVGLRLDAQILPIAGDPPPPVELPDLATRPIERSSLRPAEPSIGPPVEPPVAPPSLAPVMAASRRPSPRTFLRVALAAALLASVLVLGFWWSGRRALIDAGHALRLSDLGAGSPVTEDLVRRAFAADARGDRAQAVALLEAAHRSDRTTPLPAVFLSLWGYPEQEPGARARWAIAAEGRLGRESSPYTQLLTRYARASAEGSSASIEAALSALLNLRPEAWRLRLARAHRRLALRQGPLALADLRQIPVPELTRGLETVLADRASLGDLEGAERALRSARTRGQEALVWHLRGRFARSRRRPAEALAAFDRSIREAARHNQPDFTLLSQLLGAASAFEAGDASAARRLDEAAAEARERERHGRQSEALGLGAYLAWRRGDLAGRDHRLGEAFGVAAGRSVEERQLQQVSLTLLSLWIGGRPSLDPERLAASVETTPETLGVRSLLLARHALATGRREEAGQRLRQSLAEGVDRTYFAEEAFLLTRQLGGAVRLPRVDPPYPNLLRLANAWEIQRLGPPPARQEGEQRQPGRTSPLLVRESLPSRAEQRPPVPPDLPSRGASPPSRRE